MPAISCGCLRCGVISATDKRSWNAVEDRMHKNDFHATLLHLFGFDHNRLSYRFKGLDSRLTGVAGKVAPKVFSKSLERST